MAPSFTLGEHYRIQNVEYGTYLEMVQRPTGPQLVLRAHKAFSENQQVRIGVNQIKQSNDTDSQSGPSRLFRPVKGLFCRISAVLSGQAEPRLTFTSMGLSHSTERKALAFPLRRLEASICKALRCLNLW